MVKNLTLTNPDSFTHRATGSSQHNPDREVVEKLYGITGIVEFL